MTNQQIQKKNEGWELGVGVHQVDEITYTKGEDRDKVTLNVYMCVQGGGGSRKNSRKLHTY